MAEEKRLKYEKPELLVLGGTDITLGANCTSTGSSATDSCYNGISASGFECSGGTSATNDCWSGSAAGALCGNGSGRS